MRLPSYLKPATLPRRSNPEHVLKAAGGHPWLLMRLLEQLWRGIEFDLASDKVFDEGLSNFEVWKRQLGEDGIQFVRNIPRDGVKRSAFRRDSVWRPLREASLLAWGRISSSNCE